MKQLAINSREGGHYTSYPTAHKERRMLSTEDSILTGERWCRALTAIHRDRLW